MSEPTSPKDEASADTAELPAVTEDIASARDAKPAQSPKPTAAGPTTAGRAAAGTAAGGTAADATAAAAKGAGASGKAKGAAAKAGGKKKRSRRLRGPWVTVAGALVLLLVLAALGYVWGLGPINRLNTARGINPPAKLAGLDRITDPEIRGQLQLDQTREALSRINDGKKATVEAYGSLDGDRLYVIIAVRGKVNIDQVVADSGASPDKIKKVGNATCLESSGNLPTQCYRTSNVLTVIAQSANEGVNVDQVAPVTQEAFKAMK